MDQHRGLLTPEECAETLSGRFALLEFTNLPFVGPSLHLAPSADPSEALIHASFVQDREDRRLQFSRWLCGQYKRPGACR